LRILKTRRYTCELISAFVSSTQNLTLEFLLSLVCSDLISRGIDISHVSHVVSYDVPVDMRKYVHRVGRTARAGREGDAWTLVEQQEVRPGSFIIQIEMENLHFLDFFLIGKILQTNTKRGGPS